MRSLDPQNWHSCLRSFGLTCPSCASAMACARWESLAPIVREEQHAVSDLDVLVEYERTPTLLKFVDLQYHLSDVLGVKVDLVMKRALKPAIGRRILEHVVPV